MTKARRAAFAPHRAGTGRWQGRQAGFARAIGAGQRAYLSHPALGEGGSCPMPKVPALPGLGAACDLPATQLLMHPVRARLSEGPAPSSLHPFCDMGQ